jgi:hypothetical protein
VRYVPLMTPVSQSARPAGRRAGFSPIPCETLPEKGRITASLSSPGRVRAVNMPVNSLPMPRLIRRPQNPREIFPPDRFPTVFTFMHRTTASPRLPHRYKAGRMPARSLYELVKALRNAQVGSWLSVNLRALPGSTPAAKQSSTSRTARRQFHPIQTRIKGSWLFVRRVPDPESCQAPHDNSEKRSGSFEPLSGSSEEGRQTVLTVRSCLSGGER